MRNLLPLQIPEGFQAAFPFSFKRKATLFALFLILFFTGVYTEQLYKLFDKVFFYLFSTFGIFSFLNTTQAEVSTQITMRSWPTMLTFGLLYTGLSFLTLHVYCNNSWKSKITAAFYMAVFALCALLIVLGKFIDGFDWAYLLCRRLIELVISPFPVILFLALFAGFKRKA